MDKVNELAWGASLLSMLAQPLWGRPVADLVADDFGPDERRAAFVHYAVPAMSAVQRLPDAYPADGTAGGPVRIVMAKEEYEPGSFVIWANRELKDVQLSLSAFKSEKGDVFPAEALDLKVVKVWYQNRNAWFSYFGDTGFKLCPELLLNDEDLIRVDTAKEANYARIREKDGRIREQWLNPPREIARVHWDCHRGGDAFACMRPGFEDADTLRPVRLEKGAFKQFFLTAHATKGTPAGVYRGTVCVGRLGKVPVEIRVLDFELPRPMCYFDDTRPFHVNFYNYECFGMMMELNGGDLELTKRQAAAVLKNHAAHGQDINWIRWSILEAEGVDYQKMTDEAGYDTRVMCGAVPLATGGGTSVEREQAIRRAAEAVRARYGDREVYVPYGDEPPAWWLQKTRKDLELVQRYGFRLILAGSDSVYRKAGYQYDWHNIAKTPEDDSSTRLWNQFGSSARVAWYAQMHVGVENPDFNRRQNGMAAYLSNYSCLCNYAHHFGSYNDDSEGYKPMVFTYGQAKGVLDTLQWEGFREGLDDIRYATVLVKLARRASAQRADMRLRFEGNKALQFLAEFRKDADDLNACRLEMIRLILRLQGLLKRKI